MAYPDPPATPQVPQRGDRATFSARVDAFLLWVAAIIPWLQGFVADVKASLNSFAAGGANSFTYVFDSSTSDSGPGPGKLRLSAINQSAATSIRMDDLTADNVNISQFLSAVTNGTSAVKASIRIQKVKDPSSWLLFDITAASGSGYKNLTVVPRAGVSASPFSNGDQVSLFFDRNGDSAAAGVLELVAGAQITTAVANIDYLNVFNDAYEKYIVEVVGLTPTINGDALRIFLSDANGSVINSGYEGAGSTAYIYVSSGGIVAQRAGDYCNLTIEFKAVRKLSEIKGVDLRGFFKGSSPIQYYAVSTSAMNSTLAKVNGFRLNWQNGSNFARGYVKIYGLKAA